MVGFLVPAFWGDVCCQRLPFACLGVGLVFFGGMGSGCVGLVWGCAPAFWGDVCRLSVCSEFGLVWFGMGSGWADFLGVLFF